MLSEAGRSYDKTRVVSPYRTRQRFRYYQLPPVEGGHPEPKLYQTLETNLREKRDSFLLRYAKDITVNTNHSPAYDLPKANSPRHSFPQAPLIRFIGDVRDEDYTKPLQENCNHRCAHANNVTVDAGESDEGGNSSQRESRTEELPLLCMKSDKNASLTTISPLDYSKQMVTDLKSTDHSLLKRRSKVAIEPQPAGEKLKEREKQKERVREREREKQLHRRGVSFDSSIGHQYLRQVENRERYPECYDIEKSNESLIRNSMKQPHGHVKFPLFRNSIATRYDRPDPHWHLALDTSNCQLPRKDDSYDFAMHSERRINEVKSKYPFRQCMNFHIFPNKDATLAQE